MLSLKETANYNYKVFLEEARNILLKSQGAVYVHLIFAKGKTWSVLEDFLDGYSIDGRRVWLVNITASEDDFYIVQFVNKEDAEDVHHFFWKVWREDPNYVTILSFSVEKFKYIQSCLKSLLHYIKGMWFAWIDSRLLENFDEFVKTIFGDIVYSVDRASCQLRPIGRIGQRAVEVRWAFRDKKEIAKRRKSEYEDFGRICYVKRIRCSIRTTGYTFKVSIADEGEILLEQGDLFAFMEIVRPLISSLSKIRDLHRKRIDFEIAKIEAERKKYELRSIGLLEVLVFEAKEPTTENWFENITKVFSAPYLKEDRLVNFPLTKGNPYFLAHVIDIENGSAVYLSATGSEVRISPASEETSSATVSKIVQVVQKYIDPTLIPQLI